MKIVGLLIVKKIPLIIVSDLEIILYTITNISISNI